MSGYVFEELKVKRVLYIISSDRIGWKIKWLEWKNTQKYPTRCRWKSYWKANKNQMQSPSIIGLISALRAKNHTKIVGFVQQFLQSLANGRMFELRESKYWTCQRFLDQRTTRNNIELRQFSSSCKSMAFSTKVSRPPYTLLHHQPCAQHPPQTFPRWKKTRKWL